MCHKFNLRCKDRLLKIVLNNSLLHFRKYCVRFDEKGGEINGKMSRKNKSRQEV